MPVAEVHPTAEELTAFTLGILGDEAHGSIEAHVAVCTSCQERAAVAPGDTLTELLRCAHAHTRCQAEMATQSAQAQTPAPLPATLPSVTMSRAAVPPVTVDQVRPAVPDNVPPELADHERYRVVRLLGAGGMGAVYEAEHRAMRRTVALKVINRASTSSAGAVERFRREVRAAARLLHPNIVTAYDAENAGDTHFLVMEYVEGTSLGRLVKERGPLPLAEACEYVRQAALGLQHAHERGMVHRDVKPDNLILTASPPRPPRPDAGAGGPRPDAGGPGVVKVLDFGLAALTAERGAGLTDENVVMGTPEYMAPEQAEDARKADIRADVYSLGCTLYQLLTGSVPYPAETALLRILAHREHPLPSIRHVRPEVPQGLADVLGRMLAKRPQERQATPGEVAAALVPFTKTQPVQTARSRRPLLAVVLAALLLLAAAVVYRIQTDKGELVITTESDDVEVVIKQGGKLVRIIDTKTDKSITLRSGVYELELKGAEGLKLDIDKATLTRGEKVLARIERVAKGAAPADASAVKFIQPLHRIPFGGGDRFYCVDVTQDGRFVLAGRGRMAKTRIWEVQTGKLYRELDGTVARFTPDGSHVIATSWNEFNVYELSTGKLVRQFASSEQCCNFFLSPGGTRLYNQTRTNHEIYDWATGKQLCRIPWRRFAFDLALLTHDGRYLLHQPERKPPLRVLDTATGKEVDAFRQLRDMPELGAISADGNRVMCYVDRGYTIFDVATGKHVAKIEAPGGGEFSGNGRLLLTTTNQRDDYGVWDVDSGRLLARLQFPEPFAGIFDRRISRDNRYAVFAGPGDFVYVFRLPESPAPEPPAAKDALRMLHRVDWRSDGVLAGHVAPGGRYFLASLQADGHFPRGVRVWDGETGKILWDNNNGHWARFSPDGEQVYVLENRPGEIAAIRAYRTATGEPLRVICRPTPYTLSFYLSPDGQYLSAQQQEEKFSVWRVADSKLLRQWSGSRGWEFSPDSKHIGVKVEGDDRRRLYPLPSLEEVPLSEPLAAFDQVDAQPAGQYGIAGEFKAPPESRWLIEADGRKVQRWLPRSYVKMLGAANWINRQESLVSLEDGTLRLFDVVTQQERSCFRLPQGEKALRIDFSPQRDFATAVTNKGAILLFKLPPPPAKGKP